MLIACCQLQFEISSLAFGILSCEFTLTFRQYVTVMSKEEINLINWSSFKKIYKCNLFSNLHFKSFSQCN